MRDLGKKVLEHHLAMYRDGKMKLEDSTVLQDLVDQIVKAHGVDGWVREGFVGLKSITNEEALDYLYGEKFKKNDRYLKADDLQVGMHVIMHHSKIRNLPFWGQSYKVSGIELPYVLLEPAVKQLNDQELVVVELARLALKRCSEDYFNAQRRGNRLEKDEITPRQDRLPF